jgi:plastocyanin
MEMLFLSVISLKTDYVVVFTDTGFHPSNLSIDPGDKVRFVNKSGGQFWPASNLHPTHTIYPDFDTKKLLPPNTEWSFSFNRSGEWKFHDHLQPRFEGKILVRGKASDYCQGSEVQVSCWESVILSKLEDEGVGAAFEVVEDLYFNRPDFASGCHQAAHLIGERAYELYATNEDFVVSQKANYCGFGFYHGFMEQMLQQSGDLSAAREFCHYVDDKLSHSSSTVGLSCFHGIGHGTVDAHDERYWGDAQAMADSAMALCLEVSGTNDELYRCASGIYNGIAIFFVSGNYGLVLNSEDPLEFCHTQEKVHRESCYGNFNVVLAWIADQNLIKAASYIDKIPVVEEREPAMRYLGEIYAINLLQNEDFSQEAIKCQTFDQGFRAMCIEGIVGGLIEHGKPDFEYEQALKFCRSFSHQTDLDICMNHIVTVSTYRYSTAKTLEICQSLPESEQHYCREKNLL